MHSKRAFKMDFYILIVIVCLVFFSSCNYNAKNRNLNDSNSVVANSNNLDNNANVHIDYVKDSTLLVEGYNMFAETDIVEYYFSSDYISEEQVKEFISINQEMIKDVNNFIKLKYNVPKLMYKISKEEDKSSISKDGLTITLSGVAQKKSPYVALYVESVLGNCTEKYIDIAVKSFFENKFSKFISDYYVENNIILLKEEAVVQAVFQNKSSSEQQSNDVMQVYLDLSNYIYSDYGLDKLIDVYQESYRLEEILNMNLDKFIKGWLKKHNIDYNKFKQNFNINTEELKHKNVSENEVKNLIKEAEYTYYYVGSKSEYGFDKNYLSLEEMADFIILSQNAIEDISSYLSTRYINLEGKIIYSVKDSNTMSGANQNNIFLGYVKEKSAEYVHETVHSMAGKSFSLWIEEGLAVYLDSIFSEWQTPPAYGKDLHEVAKEYIQQDLNIDWTFDDSAYKIATDQTELDKRIEAYLYSGSFVKYIHEQMGKEYFLRVYNNKDSWNNFTEKDFETLKNNWIKFLNNY